MKKVLIIPSWYPCTELPYAGSFIINQARALADNGIADMSILNWGQLEYQLALRSPLKSVARLKHYCGQNPSIQQWDNGITEYRIPHLSWTHLLGGGNMDRLIPKLNILPPFDLIHAHVAYPAGYVAMKLAKHSSIPFVITEHSGPFPLAGLEKSDRVLPIVLEPMTQAKAVIAVSTALQKDILKKTGIISQVIPNLVDTSFFVPAQAPSENRVFTLFALSALIAAKGIITLLEAIDVLHCKGVDLILKLGGSGVLEPHLAKEIKSRGLQNKIMLVGQLTPSQAIRYYQTCDCFIMPSYHESFSVVLAEAMACGKPVIATACGGPSDIVNEENGLLVPTQDPRALGEAIIHMMHNFHRYDPLKIRAGCLANYSPHIVAQAIGNIYNS